MLTQNVALEILLSGQLGRYRKGWYSVFNDRVFVSGFTLTGWFLKLVETFSVPPVLRQVRLTKKGPVRLNHAYHSVHADGLRTNPNVMACSSLTRPAVGCCRPIENEKPMARPALEVGRNRATSQRRSHGADRWALRNAVSRPRIGGKSALLHRRPASSRSCRTVPHSRIPWKKSCDVGDFRPRGVDFTPSFSRVEAAPDSL